MDQDEICRKKMLGWIDHDQDDLNDYRVSLDLPDVGTNLRKKSHAFIFQHFESSDLRIEHCLPFGIPDFQTTGVVEFHSPRPPTTEGGQP